MEAQQQWKNFRGDRQEKRMSFLGIFLSPGSATVRCSYTFLSTRSERPWYPLESSMLYTQTGFLLWLHVDFRWDR